MKKILIISTLLLGIIAFATWYGLNIVEQNKLQPDGTVLYQNKLQEFQLSYPADWEQDKTVPSETAAFHKQDKRFPNLAITKLTPEEMSLKRAVEVGETNLSRLPNCEFYNKTSVQINNNSVVKQLLTFTNPEDGQELQALVAFITSPNKPVYLFIYKNTPASFTISEAEQILDTFSFLE